MKKKNPSANIINTFCNVSDFLSQCGEEYISQLLQHSENSLKEMANQNQDNEDVWFSFLKDFTILMNFLHLSAKQCIVFVALYSEQINQHDDIDWNDVCKFLQISPLKYLPLRNTLEEMAKIGVLQCQCKKGKIAFKSYIASEGVEQALQDNKPYKQKKPMPLNRYRFCQLVSDFITEEGIFETNTKSIVQNIEKFEKKHHHLKLVNHLKKMHLSSVNRIIFYCMCDDFMRGRTRQTYLYSCLSSIYDQSIDTMGVMRSFFDQKHPLQTNDLVELSGADFSQDAIAKLTEKGRKLLLEEDFDLFVINQKSNENLIRPDSIREKHLFFKPETHQKLDGLKTSLMEEQFLLLQQRLEENAMPKAMTVLFYGGPGTGKTEAVMQLAKATGRSIFHVDISACKSKWFGESEKIMKGIFEQYRAMCKQEALKPILLFNEADAIFNKRKDTASSSVAQTENTIQNILLEEMEHFDGILVATTNLANNFDDAFARRFLFKIMFDKPSKEAKTAIWKDKLSWLDDNQAAMLAQNHDLSGGEIDNVVRKTLMEEVIHGIRPTLETLSQWCSEEKMGDQKGKAIGFVA